MKVASDRSVKIIVITDSPSSPIFDPATHRFLVTNRNPRLFMSSVALTAFLDTLMAFVMADASPKVVSNVENFHRQRFEIGAYLPDSQSQPRPRRKR